MSEIERWPMKVVGVVRRIGINAILAAGVYAFASLLIPTYAAAGTVTETFDGFTCPGAWVQDPSGPNTSYIRDCGNGWTAYAEDTANPGLDTTPPFPGPIGNQNIVALDPTVNGPSALASTPLASALLNTAPGNAPIGVLWLLKTFPVQAGVPLQTIKADARIKITASTSENYGIVVFNGIVTNPSGIVNIVTNLPKYRTDVLSGKVIASGTTSTTGYPCSGVAAGSWCAWQVLNAGGQYIVPTSSYITVGFRVVDTSNTQAVFGEVDNVTVSGVVTSGDPTLNPNDLAQISANTYQASGSNNMVESADVVVDSANNSYVTGSQYNGLNNDIVTMKYDAAGNLLWSTAALPYDGGNGDEAVAMARGPAGNIYVLGRSYVLNNPSNLNDPANNNDYVVIKYDAGNGNELWHQSYDHNMQDDVPTGLVVNANGVYVTGSTCSSATACDYATIKLDPNTGGLLWERFYDGIATGDQLDKAIGVKLDLIGNVYVTGTSTGGSDDIVTIKYDSAGTKLWESRYDSGWVDRASAFAVDNAGNSYVAGMTYAGGSPAIIALKYDSDGNQQWVETASGSADGATLASALAIDGAGDVYITGKTGRVTDHDIITIKYLSDGTTAWVHTFGTAGLDDWGVDIAVDGSGNTYVLGAMTRGVGNTDFVTVKYDAAGTPSSAITYDAFTRMDTPSALALGVDSGGDALVYTTGTSVDLGGLNEMATVRYQKARADLTVTAVTNPATAVVGSSIAVNETVLNIKDLVAKKYNKSGAFDVGIYLTPTGSGLPDLNNLIFLGSRHVLDLDSGQSSSATDTVPIPATVAEGRYYVVVVADINGTVMEQDETNNAKAAATTIAITGTKPDLAVTALSGPSNITRGVPFDVTTTVSNLVSTAAGSFRVGVYLSTDPTITTSDTLLQNTLSIGSLLGNSSYTATISVTVPLATPTGDCQNGNPCYYLGVIVDDQGQVDESNENNNTAVLGGASNSTLLTTAKDFISGLPGIHVAVAGKGFNGHVTLGQSAISWALQSGWNIPSPGGSLAAPALADLNGDGLLDAMVGSGTYTVAGFMNSGTATNPVWTAMPGWNIPRLPNGSCPGQTGTTNDTTDPAPTMGDMNGDGIVDILLLGYRYGICAFQNTGTNTAPVWTHNALWDVPNATTPSLINTDNAPALADLDGDGKLDLMVGQAAGTTVFAYRNTGTSTSPIWTYTPAWNYTAPSLVQLVRPALVDINGDGKVDLLTGNSTGTVYAIQNTGTTNVPAWTRNTAWDITGFPRNYLAPAFGDLNNDGRIDVMVGSQLGVTYGVSNTGPYYANSATPPDGVYTSKVIDAGTHGGFTTLSFVTQVPSGTSLSVDIRAGDTPTPDGSWILYTGFTDDGTTHDISGLGQRRYVQYQVNLTSTNSNLTPALYSIQANTSPAPATATPVAVVVGSGGGGGGLGIIELLIMSLAAAVGGARRRRCA